MSSHALDASSTPTIIGGRYRVVRMLGRGGMGVVYAVEHAHTGDRLALKVLLGHAGADPVAIERFKRESRVPALIKSEHVVKITDADVAPELGGAPFFVMELLEGSSLDSKLKKEKLAPYETVVLLAQLARALDRAHSIGIIHRDLKPENLFLHRHADGTTTLKILDFGISKFSADESGLEMASMTTTGTVMGTPLYMSPEQARGISAQIGPPADMWAVALITFRMLTGKVYWRANTIADLILKVAIDPLVAPSTLDDGLSPEFDAWFLRSCDRDPTRRWASVAEQVDMLARALGYELMGVDTSGGIPTNVAVVPRKSSSIMKAAPAEPAPSLDANAAETLVSAPVLDGGMTRILPPSSAPRLPPPPPPSASPADAIRERPGQRLKLVAIVTSAVALTLLAVGGWVALRDNARGAASAEELPPPWIPPAATSGSIATPPSTASAIAADTKTAEVASAAPPPTASVRPQASGAATHKAPPKPKPTATAYNPTAL